MRGRVAVDRCDELQVISNSSSHPEAEDVQRRSITSVPSDAIESISAHSGTTSLILVSGLSLASCPRVSVSFAMMRPATIAVKSFEFDVMPNNVCWELNQHIKRNVW